jgi:hypothetical protein
MFDIICQIGSSIPRAISQMKINISLWGLGFKIINVFVNMTRLKVASSFLTFLEGWETSFFALGAHFFKIPTMSSFQYFFSKLKEGNFSIL